MKRIHRVVSIAAAAALAGCSGGASSPSAPYIDIGYSGPTTSVSLDSTASAGTVLTAANGGVTTFASSSSTSAIGAGSPGPSVTLQSALAALGRHRLAGSAVVTGVTQTETQPCAVSGSVTFSATIADSTGATLTAGDRISVSFSACDDGYGITAGSMSVRIDACPDNAWFLDPTAVTPGQVYAMTLTVSDFVSVDTLGYYSGIDGDMSVSMTYATDLDGAGGWMTSSVSGTRIAAEQGYQKVATSSSQISGIGGGTYAMESGEHYPVSPADWPDAYRTGLSARICSTDMGGCLDVETSAPIVQNDADPYPSSGTITYSDDAGRFVELTFTDGTTGAVTLTYDVGAGVVGPISTTLGCLDQADSSACFQ